MLFVFWLRVVFRDPSNTLLILVHCNPQCSFPNALVTCLGERPDDCRSSKNILVNTVTINNYILRDKIAKAFYAVKLFQTIFTVCLN